MSRVGNPDRLVRSAIVFVGGALAGVTLAAMPTVAASPESMVGLASHRAVYEMTLGNRSDHSEVVSVEGRLVYEFTGSKCEGWSSRFRLVTRLGLAGGRTSEGEMREGTTRLADQRTTSYEDGEGKSFDFLNQNFVDEHIVENSKGLARHEEARTAVRIDQPAPKSVDLSKNVKFPTEHLAAILDDARAGRTVSEIDLYDGSESGEKVYRTTVVIGREQTGDDDTSAEPAAGVDWLKGKRRWPVDISYFDPAKANGGEMTPDYQMSFLLYENGVSRKMRLDYGDFSLKGTLSSLTQMPVSTCP